MATHTGKLGAASAGSAVANMLSWTVNETSTPVEFVNSLTKCATARRPGVKTWAGSYIAHGGEPVVLPGASFSFQGFTSPDTDVEGASGYGLLGTAIVDSIQVDWDFSTNAPVQHTVNFSAAGALTKDPSMNLVASGTLYAPQSCDGDILWDTVSIPDMTTASMTVASNSQTYTNSTTNCEERRLGGVITWSASINVQNNFTNIKTVGTYVDMNFKISAAINDRWLIDYMLVKDYTNLAVNRDGTIIGHTIVLEGSAIDQNDILGSITPAGTGTAWWPV